VLSVHPLSPLWPFLAPPDVARGVVVVALGVIGVAPGVAGGVVVVPARGLVLLGHGAFRPFCFLEASGCPPYSSSMPACWLAVSRLADTAAVGLPTLTARAPALWHVPFTWLTANACDLASGAEAGALVVSQLWCTVGKASPRKSLFSAAGAF
jgi:hypothetical protein